MITNSRALALALVAALGIFLSACQKQEAYSPQAEAPPLPPTTSLSTTPPPAPASESVYQELEAPPSSGATSDAPSHPVTAEAPKDDKK